MNQEQEPSLFQEIKPVEHPWWQVALEHLEAQWPEKLEKLLRQGKLKEHLDKLVDSCLDQMFDAQDAGADEVEAANSVSQYLEPENPRYDPDNPKRLSPQGQELLSQFRRQHLS